MIQPAQTSEDETNTTTSLIKEACGNSLSQEKVDGYDAAMAKISSTLRAALKASKKSRYAISQETGIGESVLHKFLVLGNQLRSNNLDKLCVYFGLELTKIKGKKTRK